MMLAGDIGGTNTRLALFEEKKLKVEKNFSSKNYESLVDIVEEFLQENQVKVEKAAFGVAGPVQDNKCKATNLPWNIDADRIAKRNHIAKVFLLNDLESNAHGIKALQEEEFFILQKGNPSAKGNAALISAGTGLGEAGLYWDGKKHSPFATEGGHTDFAPRKEEEFKLWLFLQKKYGHVSYERVVSGPGIEELFTFLTEVEKEKAKVMFSEKKSKAKKISEEALSQKCPVCVRTLDWFTSLYAAEAANLSLKHLATGGLYIGGGIAPKILPFLQKDLFLEAFLNKGRFNQVLENIPIKVILNEKTALLGALEYVLSR